MGMTKIDKLLYSSFVCHEYTRNLSGVYHEKGFKIASDGHILARVKEWYPKETEGKIVLKSGEFLDTTYVNYKFFLGAYSELIKDDGAMKVLEELVRDRAFQKKYGSVHICVMREGEPYAVRTKYLGAAFKLFKAIGQRPALYLYRTYAVLRSQDCEVLIAAYLTTLEELDSVFDYDLLY